MCCKFMGSQRVLELEITLKLFPLYPEAAAAAKSLQSCPTLCDPMKAAAVCKEPRTAPAWCEILGVKRKESTCSIPASLGWIL